MRVRYVVLRHEGVEDPHFDLMIEAEPGGTLMSWRLTQWPVRGQSDARRIQDHRREYLDYEGEVSGGRGRVTRVAAGHCRTGSGSDGSWEVRFEQGWTLRLPST